MAYSRPEPLQPKHRLDGFDCGNESLNTWLLRYSRHAQAVGSARTFVTTDDGAQVVGYYALAVGEVRPADATTRLLKGQPQERPVPVVVLARLAVDRRHRGKRIGRSLLQDGMLRCAGIAEHVGIRALVAHAVDDAARGFYLKFGFEESPTDPLHLILLIKDLKRLIAELADRYSGALDTEGDLRKGVEDLRDEWR